MINKNLLTRILVVVAVLCIMSAPYVFAQDICKGNFDYDQDVDGGDAYLFKVHFGRSSYDNPCPPDGPAPLPKTGTTISISVGDNGDLQKGVAWPEPRFTDNSDGTITDNLTGLIWLKNANCFDLRTWEEALSECNGLSAGQCGLTDGSSAGDWRLPNRRELLGLIDDGSDTMPMLPWEHPFANIPLMACSFYGDCHYWSSTVVSNTRGIEYYTEAWLVDMGWGWSEIASFVGDYQSYVWPVRGGY